MYQQRTIREKVSFEGIGIHTGDCATVEVLPADLDWGISIECKGKEPNRNQLFPDLVYEVVNSTDILIGNKTICTVEHLLSALTGLGISNARIVIDGKEIPYYDGSALYFINEVRKVGIIDQPGYLEPIIITEAIECQHEDKKIIASPSNDLHIEYHIDFPTTFIGRQSLDMVIKPDNYAKQIAPARSFITEDQVQSLLDSGKARGGDIESAVILGKTGLLYGKQLRFFDEPVRHKILDLIGDLTLLGKPVQGHFKVLKGGHALHNSMVREIARRYL